MYKSVLKKIVINIVGVVLACIPFFGVYPFGIAYFTAVYMENAGRLTTFFVILASMIFTIPILQGAKYGISMLLVVILIGLMEANGQITKKGTGAFLAGLGVFLMNLSDNLLSVSDTTLLIKSALEGIFIFSTSIIFMKCLEFFLEEKEKMTFEETRKYYGKNRLKEFSDSFQKLSNTFTGLQNSRELLTKYKGSSMDYEFSKELCYSGVSEGELRRNELYWENRLTENRMAIASQLREMSKIMQDAADDIFEIENMDSDISDKIKRRLRKMNIIVKKMLVMEKKDQRQEIHITMKIGKKGCMSTRDIGNALTGVCNKRMVPSENSKTIIGNEFSSVIFVEDTNFKILYGIAKKNKNNERISGDNFSVTHTQDGHFYMSLSDGMGTGILAHNESEIVIELLEQFLEAGFCKETAVKMINSTLVMRSENQVFSTIDISEIDLYSGVCEFLKIGASTTFIKREGWVESIQSTNLPIGMLLDVDLESSSKKLYSGDFIIMVTDGVLDGMVEENPEKVLCDIIMNVESKNPKELADKILQETLYYSGQQAQDDMTVIAAGIWEK